MAAIKKSVHVPAEEWLLEPDPLWYKDAIIYELHVKSFFDGNDDGIGDFTGLIRKLDYLQSLGVNCLWLLPFYPSPLKDDGYDISDYRGINPAYGTLKDFRSFIRAAHCRGLRVIIELVVNHTSDQHPWFQAARLSPPGSTKRNYYVWSDNDRKYKGTRIIFTDSEKSNWTWDPVAQAYYWHRFFHHQPDLNFDNPHVVRAVIGTMRYWLEMGVDGLRLDAVPYLVEREGTTCENLPETHAVLKEMRRRLDTHYKDRMFLAEANQWPPDVRAYFGNGDECHMAFHFPLMPRIFMAIRQEDRHPITEIMRQTPGIPDNCQWALFLRNHDELTLEMVTDEERDYMYYEYANDPQMRLNLGIRRRLAPLLENGRRQLELLHSFLFSFPGTPVIYYGDEIAMGDNIFLGDRNSVRTPMQWTGDRNAGFSRADPARLFSPLVMDPVYGYQAVNVESQERNASSFMNWMKRMIALRRRMKVFSRGSIEFIYPQNRKVLAYIRSYRDETVLVVANLSRFIQPVELELTDYKGLSPIELIGKVEFPVIGEHPYFLSLAPHSFYWFQLKRKTASVVSRTFSFQDLPTVTMAKTESGWLSLFKGNAKRQLETDLLPKFLLQQRWFAGKSKKLIYVRIAEWTEIKGGDAPSFFVIADAEFVGGSSEAYLIPLSVATGSSAESVAQHFTGSVVARLNGYIEPAVLFDGLREDATCTLIFNSIQKKQDFKTDKGVIRALPGSAFNAILRESDTLPFKVSLSAAEQSNTSILYGERFILKMFRRIQPGMNPEYEIGSYLTEISRFKNVPRTGGGITYEKPDGSTVVLGVIHEFMENQGTGWNYSLNELNRYFERVASLRTDLVQQDCFKHPLFSFVNDPYPALAEEIMKGYLKSARTLGKRTAELHKILSQQTHDPAFAPEPLTAAGMANSAARMKERGQKALRSLENNLSRLSDAVRDKAHRILSERKKLLDCFNPPAIEDVAGGRIRVHGDYHLGQVLWVENDFVILDFEGEPARSLQERRAKESPLKDIAGMVGSFDYAAYSALNHYTQDHPQGVVPLSFWAGFWRLSAAKAFLKGYLAEAEGAPFFPKDSASLETLLTLYSLDKTLYELQYELHNRPAWIQIPIEKIISFMERK